MGENLWILQLLHPTACSYGKYCITIVPMLIYMYCSTDQVIVRMCPPNKDDGDGELIVQKNSGDSLSIAGQTFTFDSVADFTSTQAR